MEHKGILRNKKEGAPVLNSEGDLDRQEVIRNTRLNAQLVSESKNGDRIRAKISEAKSKNGEHLTWDEINLYQTEQEKAATMRIDEPKTPYEGGFDPTGEYYRDDNEGDEESVSIPDFSLGDSAFEPSTHQIQSLNGGEILRDDEEEEEEEEEEEKPLLAEEKHRQFEERRKAHYLHAANPLKHKVVVSDDEESN